MANNVLVALNVIISIVNGVEIDPAYRLALDRAIFAFLICRNEEIRLVLKLFLVAATILITSDVKEISLTLNIGIELYVTLLLIPRPSLIPLNHINYRVACRVWNVFPGKIVLLR